MLKADSPPSENCNFNGYSTQLKNRRSDRGVTEYFVEFSMTGGAGCHWVRTEALGSFEAAVELEAQFHATGWKARALRIKQEKTFLN